MISFSSLAKRRGATLAGIFSLALSCAVLLCGAGSVPVENFLPQGAMQADLNAGGHNLTNAATVYATNVVVSGSLTAPASFTLPFSKLTSVPTSLSGYGITDPIVLTSGSYSNPSWITSLATSKLTGSITATTVPWSGVTSTPTSLSGYGITDPIVLTSGSYSNPSWITSLATSKLTGSITATTAPWSGVTSTPTTISGYGITDGVTLTGSQTLTNKSIAASEVNSGMLAIGQIPTGTTSTTVPLGNDTRFPASVTGLRLGAGAGSADTAATSAQVQSVIGSGVYDVSGAASTAQAASVQKSNNGSDFASAATTRTNLGVPGLSTVNAFLAAQLFTGGIQIPTGPEKYYMIFAGDSRISHTGWTSNGAWSSDPNLNFFNNSPDIDSLSGLPFSWSGARSTLPTAVQEMGFGVNSLCMNWGQSGCGIQNAINTYALGCVTTTGNITSGSDTVTITGSTTGITGTMIVEGPGIRPGTTATISGSTVTLFDSFYYGRTPTVSTTGATLVFMPEAQSAMVQSGYFSANSALPVVTPFNTPCIHQWSPAVTGVNGVLFCEYGVNDCYAWSSSATVSTSSKTITGITLPSSVVSPGYYNIPVGYAVTGTDMPANTTVVSNTASSITLNNYPTGSASGTITVTPVLTAFETQYASYVTTALADNYAVVILTPWNSWSSPWSTGQTFLASMGSWLKSNYASTSNVYVVDTASLSYFSSNDLNIYQDGTHLTSLGNSLVASYIEQVLGPQFTAGPPQTIGGPGSIPPDWLQNELGSLAIGPLPDNNGPILYLNGGSSTNGTQTVWGTSQAAQLDYFDSGTVWEFVNPSGGGMSKLALSVNGSTSQTGQIPSIPTAGTTSVSGTTGTATVSEPFYQTGYKKVVVYMSGYQGTNSISFPTTFTHAPVETDTGGYFSGVGTSGATLSTGATTNTGFGVLEGY